MNGQETDGSMAKSSYGRRIFVNVIDEVARKDPSRLCLSIPHPSDAKKGWMDIDYGRFANSINRLARWIIERAGPSPDSQFPTFAYIGPNDIRYLLFLAAAVKCQRKVLFISPRNNKESQLSLFEATDCQWLVYAPENEAMVQPWLRERNMKSAVVDDIDTLLDEEKVPHIPYTKDFEAARWDPFMILHTSGSTGTPKPIIGKHGMIAMSDFYHLHATWQGYDHLAKGYSDRAKRALLTTPLFHALGVIVFLALSIYWEAPMVLARADKPITPETVITTVEESSADAVILPPSVLAEMSNYDEYIEPLKKLAYVTTGGGALDPEAGDRLVKAGVELQLAISSTEYGFYPVYWQPRKELWQYFIYNNDLFGCDYQQKGEGIYEQIVVRNSEEAILQGPFYTFPGTEKFETKDLYERHPTLANHWRHAGRVDDVIVFSNGEKLNPVTIEAIVGSHPEVKRAVVVGHSKFQAGMILEPVEFPKDDKSRLELLERLWPLMETVNAQTVAHGKVARHMMTLSNPKKPFPYSSKGSLQRGLMLKLYKDEIESLYSDTDAHEIPELDFTSQESLMQSIKRIFQGNLRVSEIDPDADLFQQGLDSLQAINVSKTLDAGLESEASRKVKMAPRVLYENPTPRLLSEYIYSRILGDQSSEESTINKTRALEAMLQEQIQAFPEPPAKDRPAPQRKEQTVVLTGSTGSLGSYLLEQMESSPDVKRVICLNRSADGGKSTQPLVNKPRGLRTSFSKAEFYHADLSKDKLGLRDGIYAQLLDSADYFVHCAWSVNFNHALQTFEPQIRGVANLVKFASQTRKQLPIVFLSSIGSVDLWNKRDPIPESHIPDLSISSNGYGQSKMLSSAILFNAMQKLEIPTKIIRVGQIAGSQNEIGEWNRQEWLPSIIASSLHLGLLPDSIGSQDVVQWMPIEGVASAVLEISGITYQQADSGMTGYFNLLNPSEAHWKDLTKAVQDFYLQKGHPLQIVSLATWVEAVEASAESGQSHAATKLLETFKAMASEVGSYKPAWSLDRATTASTTLKNMGPVTSEMMQRWCRQWSFEDDLPRASAVDGE